MKLPSPALLEVKPSDGKVHINLADPPNIVEWLLGIGGLIVLLRFIFTGQVC